METTSPQTNYFAEIKKFRKLSTISFWAIFLLSISNSILKHELIGFVNAIVIVLYFGFIYYVDFILVPKAENVRLRGFLDNSFKTKFNEEDSKNYFSNDEIKNGIYKMGVNLFENLLFTYNISRKMRSSKSKFPLIIFAVVLIYLSYIGFKNSQFFAPILQTFLSAYIIGEFIKLHFFVEKNGLLYNELRTLFQHIKEHKEYQYEPIVMKLALEYEANLMWANLLLDSKIYNKLNPRLSERWEEMKKECSIIEAKNE